MRLPQGWEWLIILAVILLLFGARRLPDAARGLGRSLRIFKAETKGLREDDDDVRPTASSAPEPVVPPTVVPEPPAPDRNPAAQERNEP